MRKCESVRTWSGIRLHVLELRAYLEAFSFFSCNHLSEFRGHAMAEIQGPWLRRLWLMARTLVHT